MDIENKRFNILVVDDEKLNITMLKNILADEYDISVAKDGAMALHLAEVLCPDLILLDVVMDGIDGFEVLRTLKGCAETSSIPVIFVTSLVSPDIEDEGFRLGAVDYITKPYRPATVRARVRTQINTLIHMQKLEHLGLSDVLTGIPNRRSFDMVFRREWESACRGGYNLSLMMIDIDNFKDYNDTFGHPQGDLMLINVANVLRNSLARPNDFVARLGGEEFVVLLPNCDLTGAKCVGERIRKSVEQSQVLLESTGEPTSRTVSLGVATVFPAGAMDSGVLLQAADKAMYTAKKSGRNKLVGDIVHIAVSTGLSTTSVEPYMSALNGSYDVWLSLFKLFKWDDSHNSGNEYIDKQHRSLIHAINDVIDNIDNVETVLPMLRDLVTSCAEHFKYEEAVLSRIVELPYGMLDEHIKIHTLLRNELSSMVSQLDDLPQIRYTLLTALIYSVVITHLQEEDAKYFAYTRV